MYDPTLPGTHYDVRAQENMQSIAFRSGHRWHYIWHHAGNAQLREQRSDPQVLASGDRLFIPPLRMREIPVTTEQRHRFRRNGVPAVVRFRALFLGEPLASLPFHVELGQVELTGTTSDDGVVQFYASPDCPSAKVTVQLESIVCEYQLAIRALPPIETEAGLECRLRQLGFLQPEGRLSDALACYQYQQGLDPTGKADGPTTAELLRHFGR